MGSHTVIVVAAPNDLRTRVGASFSIEQGQPLLVGPSRGARVRVSGRAGNDLAIEVSDDGVRIKGTGRTISASLNGDLLPQDPNAPFTPGDSLYLEPGWVLALGPLPNAHALDGPLAQRLHQEPNDEAAWAIYTDMLLEAGHPLGQWLRGHRHATAELRQQQLGSLAEVIARDHVRLWWSERGLVQRVRLTRAGLTAEPGSWWLYQALKREPLCRFVQHLNIEYFAAQPAPATQVFAQNLDLMVEDALCSVQELPCLSGLRTLCFGYQPQPLSLPRTEAKFQELKGQAPNLVTSYEGLIHVGTHGKLKLLATPADVSVAKLGLNETRPLGLGRNELGAGANATIRLMGPQLAPVVAVISNTGGQWAVGEPEGANGHHRVRVNGIPMARALLFPRDVIEPVPGLLLEFSLEP